MPDAKKVLTQAEKNWEKTEGGLWYVQKIASKTVPYRGLGGESWALEFSPFVPTPNLPSDLFTADALGLPAGSRIIDRTVRPEKITGVEEPIADVSRIEKVVGPLPVAMPRSPITMPQR